MRILEEIIQKSGKTQENLAIEMDWARMSLYKRIRYPKKMTFEHIDQLAKAVGKSPRTLVALILKNY